MKNLALRMPEDLLDWIRDEAARETIARKDRVSMNTLILEILTKAKEAREGK
jgi:hypothetical protein